MLSACWLIGAYFLAVSSHKRGRFKYQRLRYVPLFLQTFFFGGGGGGGGGS